MDTNVLISILQESLFVIVVFFAFFFYALIRGRQAITNVILGLYLALLISLKFPFFEHILQYASTAKGRSIIMIVVFGVFTLLATILFARLMPREYDESTFEGFGKKLVYAIGATILVMAYSYHALPITELVDPGSPIQSLFAPHEGFFVWLVVPLALLFVL